MFSPYSCRLLPSTLVVEQMSVIRMSVMCDFERANACSAMGSQGMLFLGLAPGPQWLCTGEAICKMDERITTLIVTQSLVSHAVHRQRCFAPYFTLLWYHETGILLFSCQAPSSASGNQNLPWMWALAATSPQTIVHWKMSGQELPKQGWFGGHHSCSWKPGHFLELSPL